MRIAIDAMGGEGGVAVTLPASLQALQHFPSLHLILVGNEQSLISGLQSCPENLRQRLSIVSSTAEVADNDEPISALRKCRQSSMALAIDAVAGNHAEAAVSAGNTGALLLFARHILKTLPGIDKPALVASIPASIPKPSGQPSNKIASGARASTKQALLLDVGANPDCSAEQLHQFALIGNAVHEAYGAKDSARVALLNIGAEEYKGSENTQLAAELMTADPRLNYLGFVEGDELFSGIADVIVCDGFVGNVTIKSAAGVARLLSGLMSPEQFALVNPGRLNGAMIIGLHGSVVKSHSKADQQGFYYAIKQAIAQVENNVSLHLSHKLKAN